MRKYFLLLFLLPQIISAQKSTGVITIDFSSNLTNEREINLFRSPADTIAYCKCKGVQQLDSALTSFFYFGGSNNIAYQCVGESWSRWAIMDNIDPKKICWIEKDSLNSFVSWYAWWNDADGVTAPTEKGNRFHTEPNERSRLTEPSTCSCTMFDVLAIEGDWILVSYSWGCDEYGDGKPSFVAFLGRSRSTMACKMRLG
ncbi:MAG: hypothetical protein HY064_15165 [Bacteroidetes bacterium]|nr:hypothetical protein [Bacteroidota bacterium]